MERLKQRVIVIPAAAALCLFLFSACALVSPEFYLDILRTGGIEPTLDNYVEIPITEYWNTKMAYVPGTVILINSEKVVLIDEYSFAVSVEIPNTGEIVLDYGPTAAVRAYLDNTGGIRIYTENNPDKICIVDSAAGTLNTVPLSPVTGANEGGVRCIIANVYGEEKRFSWTSDSVVTVTELSTNTVIDVLAFPPEYLLRNLVYEQAANTFLFAFSNYYVSSAGSSTGPYDINTLTLPAAQMGGWSSLTYPYGGVETSFHAADSVSMTPYYYGNENQILVPSADYPIAISHNLMALAGAENSQFFYGFRYNIHLFDFYGTWIGKIGSSYTRGYVFSNDNSYLYTLSGKYVCRYRLP